MSEHLDCLDSFMSPLHPCWQLRRRHSSGDVKLKRPAAYDEDAVELVASVPHRRLSADGDTSSTSISSSMSDTSSHVSSSTGTSIASSVTNDGTGFSCFHFKFWLWRFLKSLKSCKWTICNLVNSVGSANLVTFDETKLSSVGWSLYFLEIFQFRTELSFTWECVISP